MPIEAKLIVGLTLGGLVLFAGKVLHSSFFDPEVFRKTSLENELRDTETQYGQWFHDSAFRRWALRNSEAKGGVDQCGIFPNLQIAEMLFGENKSS